LKKAGVIGSFIAKFILLGAAKAENRICSTKS